MWSYLFAFLVSLVVSAFLVPRVRELAIARNWVDLPSDPRKIHDSPIPRVGGVAIAVAFLIPIVALVVLDTSAARRSFTEPGLTIGLILGGLMALGLGFVDDLKGLSAKKKLVGQTVIAIMAYSFGYQVEIIAGPFDITYTLGWLSPVVTVLWIVGLMNAINLIDGLDGLAGGLSLISVSILFALSLLLDNPMTGLTAAALGGALLGFFPYNHHPASIFMGDSGSLFLGYVLSVTAIAGSTKSHTLVSVLIPLLAFVLPLFDASLAIVRRFARGESIFKGDRGHIHHQLVDRGLSHPQVVLLLCGVGALLGVLGLASIYANHVQSALLLILVTAVLIVLSRSLGYFDRERWKNTLRYGVIRKGRLQSHLEGLERVILAVENAEDWDAIRAALASCPLDLDICSLEWKVEAPAPRSLSILYKVEGEGGEMCKEPHRLLYRFEGAGKGIGPNFYSELCFCWPTSPGQALKITESPALRCLALVLRDRASALLQGAVPLPLDAVVSDTAVSDTLAPDTPAGPESSVRE